MPDRMGHQMMVNSVQGRFSDNQPFYTYMDYYHKDCGGPPKCWDSTRYGDALVVINPNTGGGQTARFQAYRSINNGTTWTFVGDYSVGPEGAVLIGGTSQLTNGDYLVVPYGSATAQGLPLITYKGSAINKTNETQNTGALYGVAENGTKAANSGQAIYGLAGTGSGPNIIITALAAGTSYQVWQYVPTTGVTADWPLTGNTGTWTNVATGGPLALGASATYTTPADGLYKVEVTGGSAEALFGSNMFTNFGYGDGDQVASLDNASVDWLTGQSNSVFKGRDFRFTSGPQNGGNIIVVAPNTGTTVQVTGGSLNTGGGSGRTTSGSPPASTVVDQGWRFEISASNAAYRIQASDDVMVFVQDRGNDHEAKAFAGMPLVLCVVQTPTSTATPTSTRTATPTPTATATRTATPTPSVTGTPTSTSTQSPGPSPTDTATATATPSFTRTATASPTSTVSPSATPTASSTSTQSPGPSPTNSPSSTATPSRTQTSTATPSVTETTAYSPTDTPSFTATRTITPSASGTPSYSATFTRTATPSITLTVSATDTRTVTPTPSASPSLTVTRSITSSTTVSPTITVSWTVSPTPVPVPHQVRIGAYNSAGELVRLLYDGPAQYQIGALDVGSGVVAGGQGSLNLHFPGYIYDAATGGYKTGLSWAADNDNGQFVSSGVYTLKAEIRDPFGQVTTLQQSVQVLNVVPQNSLSIYNSAGELVTRLALPSGGTGRFSAMRFNDEPLALKVDPATGTPLSNPLTIWVRDEKGVEFAIAWNGFSDQGRPVASGSYTAELVYAPAGQARQVISSKGLVVIQAGPVADLESALVYPNPARRGEELRVRYTPSPGSQALGQLYNLAGERLAIATDPARSGELRFHERGLAGGVYLIRVEKRAGNAVLASKNLKAALVR